MSGDESFAAKLEKFTLIKQGAEARLYLGTFSGRQTIVKERFRKLYRHLELDEILTKERIRSESKMLARCRTSGIHVPTVYMVHIPSRCIYMEYLSDTVTVKDFMMQGERTVETLERLFTTIGRTISKLHSSRIIHGDLTTSNILVRHEDFTSAGERQPHVYLIDFGLSCVSDSAEDKGVDLYVLERAMLSTHPNSEALFGVLIEAYKSGAATVKESLVVMNKFEEVKLRGRKRTMLG